MIKNIVFDMGGVIMNWDPVYIASKLSDDQKEKDIMVNDIFGSDPWNKMDEGVYTPKEAIQALSTGDKNYNKVVENTINNWYQAFEEFDDMYHLIQELDDKGYNLYLLSNCSIQIQTYKDKVKSFKYLKGMYCSYESKLLKPDSKIYLDFLNRYDLKGEECVFIDDNKDNATASQTAKMHGYHYQKDINNLKKYILSLK
ncbi:MAG: HAD-IA family hydrolase [Thomasclavelia sp.]|nr:HAD-IA family hydrolase [Thomasclavelia sp.]